VHNGPVATILIISGSPSAGSRTLLLAKEVGRRLAAESFGIDFVNVRELPAEDLLYARVETPAIKAAVAQVEAAQAIVVATPIYKAAYAGALKVFLDLLPQFALTGKTVLPIATGGTIAHVLAIDYGLRPVLASLAARHIVNGYFFLDKQLEKIEPDGIRIDPAAEEKFRPVLADFIASVRAQPLIRSTGADTVSAAASALAATQERK
jgi:FMN reductase